MKELREAGNIDTANWYKNSRIPELREQLKGLKADLKAVGKEIAENKKAQNKLFSADFDNKVAAQQRLIDSNTKKWEKATDAISKYSDAELMRKARLKDFNRENDRLFSGLNKILDLEEKSEKLNRRQLQQLSKLTAGRRRWPRCSKTREPASNASTRYRTIRAARWTSSARPPAN